MVDSHGPPQGNSADLYASFVSSSLLGVAISFPILATAAVVLRFVARRRKGTGRYRADDWVMLFTLIMCWGHSINTIVAGAIGGINHITMPPREYANVALRTLWISLFFLVTSLYTVKLSILLFYHHLFSIKYAFRIAVYVMISMISLWWLSAFILIFLNTDPIESAWKDAAHAKHRFNFNNWYLSYSALSIFFDVTILCFPIPMIKSLHVNTRKKLSILGIFWLGAFVCVSAIIRFVFVYRSIFRLTNLGQNNYSLITVAFIWAEVEPSTAVIAACLPTYGPLFPDKGFLTPVVQTVKSFFHIPATSRNSNNSHTARKSATNSSGYYELDKTIASKTSGGDIFEIQDKRPIGARSGTGTDVEAQKNSEDTREGTNLKHGVPRAWLPRS